ncbi:MAG: bifunctional 4-hydroxy-2-oxoglutarate aldolase/2-dehydro-3-deoxy-phosphogluconate aldolase [Micromonosporaceae bacterium]
MSTFDDMFGGHRVMAVLRGCPPAQTVELATRAWDLGIEVVEVPIGDRDQVPSLVAAARAATERGMCVGAGTVVSVEQVWVATEAGARYTVAPGLDLDVLAASLAGDMPHLPGVATATEVQRARAAGCGWVKAFPAASLGPAWFSAMREPFPDLSYVAIGGISAHNAAAFLAAGARMVAVGAALADPAEAEQLVSLASERVASGTG